MDLVGCGCRYCRLRCSILVVVHHGQVYLFIYGRFGIVCV